MSEYPDVLLRDPIATRGPAGDDRGVVEARHADKIRLQKREAVARGGASRPVAEEHHQLARMAGSLGIGLVPARALAGEVVEPGVIEQGPGRRVIGIERELDARHEVDLI